MRLFLCVVASFLVVCALAYRSHQSLGSARVSKLFGYTRKLDGASPRRTKPTSGAQGKVSAPVKPPGESLDRLELEVLSKYGSNAYKDALEEWDDEEDEGAKKTKAKDRAAAQKGALAQYGMVGKFQGFGGSGATKAPSKGAEQKPADASDDAENYSIDDIFDDRDDGEEEEVAVPSRRAPALLAGRLGRRLAPAPAATLAVGSKRSALTVAELLGSADAAGSIGTMREPAPAKKERWARRGINAEEDMEVVANAGAGAVAGAGTTAGAFETMVVGTRRYSVPSGTIASNTNTNTAALAASSQPRAFTTSKAPSIGSAMSKASPQPAFRLRQPPPKTAEEVDKEAAAAARALADEEARVLRRKQRRAEEKSEYVPFDFSSPLSPSQAQAQAQAQAADGDDEEAGGDGEEDVDVEADRVFSSVTFEELFASCGLGLDPAILSAQAEAEAEAQAQAEAEAQAQAQLLAQPKTRGRNKSNTASMPQALLAQAQAQSSPTKPTQPTQPAPSHLLTSTILANLASMKLFTPTRVQEKTLPVLASGRDSIIHAQTGAGKTLAFLLPLLSVVDPDKNRVQALVLAPSRELVTQTAAVAERLFSNTGIRVAAIIGGANVRGQVDKLRSTRPQILVASPGRLAELVFRLDKLRLGNVRAVVLDEVDNLLQEAYRGDVELLLEASGVGRSRLREGVEAKARAAAAMAAKGMGVEPVRSELQGRIEQRLGVASDDKDDEDDEEEEEHDAVSVSGRRSRDKEQEEQQEDDGDEDDSDEPAAEPGSSRGVQFICLASATGNSPAVSAFADRYCPGGWDKVAIDAASALPRTITHALISSPRMRALEQLRKLLAAKPEVVR